MRSPHLGVIPGLALSMGKEFALELFRRGAFNHAFEIQVKQALEQKKIPVPVYLSLGTEFNGAALSMALKGWKFFPQHRGHSLFLSLGGSPEQLRDELLGLPTGVCGGMSGSNAIHCPEAGIVGHSGLLGEQIPIAVGYALASQEKTVVICGDAAAEEDYFYPALGFAVTHRLPVLFICEDNNLSILTPIETRRSWSITPLVQSFNIPMIDIADDPWLLAHHCSQLSKNLPAFITVHSVRNVWHAGAGDDGPPEWDRYQLVKEQLLTIGLCRQEIEQIEIEALRRANLVWQQPPKPSAN